MTADTGRAGDADAQQRPGSWAARTSDAEALLDRWASRTREQVAYAAARVREQADDLWAEAQHERRRRRSSSP
jgi:hypothetical protein